MYVTINKTNIFSQSSKLLKKGTVGPEGTTAESVRDALSRFIIDANESNNNHKLST